MILLVCDAPQVAKILISKLSREGFEIIWKRDGDSARQALAERTFQLIMLSTYLEQKNAWQFLQEFKQTYPAIPIVIILEQEEAQEEARAKAEGCVSSIIKPFKPTGVARMVHQILGAPISQRP